MRLEIEEKITIIIWAIIFLLGSVFGFGLASLIG